MKIDDIIKEIETSIPIIDLKEEFCFVCHCEKGYVKNYSSDNQKFYDYPSKLFAYKAIKIKIDQNNSQTDTLTFDDIITYTKIIEQLIGILENYGKVTIKNFSLTHSGHNSFVLLLALDELENNVPDHEGFAYFFNQFISRWRGSYSLATMNLNYSITKSGILLTANEDKISEIKPNIKRSLYNMLDNEFSYNYNSFLVENRVGRPTKSHNYEIKTLSDKKIEIIYKGRN